MSISYINNVINEFLRQQRERTERMLAEIITEYDFVVGSIECKCKLMEVLPEGANIVCSPYIASPTMISTRQARQVRRWTHEKDHIHQRQDYRHD